MTCSEDNSSEAESQSLPLQQMRTGIDCNYSWEHYPVLVCLWFGKLQGRPMQLTAILGKGYRCQHRSVNQKCGRFCSYQGSMWLRRETHGGDISYQYEIEGARKDYTLICSADGVRGLHCHCKCQPEMGSYFVLVPSQCLNRSWGFPFLSA